MKVGVLALQGAVAEHLEMLERLGVEACAVRFCQDFEGLDGLIIPGGESTTLEKLMRRFGLDRALADAIKEGLAVWGTCAGMILLASEVRNGIPGQTGLGHLPVAVERNAFGRQLESCEVRLDFEGLDEPFPAVFIRAPGVAEVFDTEVEGLAKHEGRVVAVRQGRILATSFHPELTGDDRLHDYFVRCIVGFSPDEEKCPAGR